VAVGVVTGAAPDSESGPKLRRFRPYPTYKDSGVGWLRQIPSHWAVMRLRSTVTSCQNGVWGDEPNGLTDVPCVRVADFDRVAFRVDMVEPTLRSIERRVLQTRGLHTGDLLLEKSGGGENQPVGAVVLYDHEALAVCSNFVARMSVADGFLPRFLVYLHAALYAARINTRSIKQSTGIQNLDSPNYLTEVAAFPHMGEQQAIAAFLDRETTRIDALVTKKERLIELLQEKRTALITRAVTKGLDPTVSMKDSGVEWLGEIPAHWHVKPLKAVSGLQTGLTLGKEYEGRALIRRPYLRVANVQDGYLALEDIAEVEVPVGDATRYELREGDVLMTEGGDFDKLGRGHVWEVQVPGCLHQNHIFAVRPRRDVLRPRFLAFTMSSGYGRAYFTATSKQSTNLASTNSSKLRNLPMPLPSLSEQDAILMEIERETTRIDGLVTKVREAIERLQELRTALISAAVTGRIDVREGVA
jgi:type I restriction enzyme, S subunit